MKKPKETKKILELLVCAEELQTSSQWLKDKIVEYAQVHLAINEEIPNEGIELAFAQARLNLQAISDILQNHS